MSEQPGLSLLRRIDSTGVPGLLARLALGLMFVYTGHNKTLDPYAFLKLLREYNLFPQQDYVWMNLIAITLPWLEVFCGVLLIAGIAVRGNALVMAGMLIPFTIVVTMRAIGIHQTTGTSFCQIKFDCGCGTGPVNICRKIPENTLLILLSFLLLWSRTHLAWTNLFAPKRAEVK